MYLRKTVLVFISLFQMYSSNAQTLLDSLSLSQQKVYKSLSFALQNPDSVFKLDLSKKKLKEVPVDIFKLKHLQILNLSRNDIKELQPEINELVNLQEFNISNNSLKSLPASIGDLTNLKHLGLNRNLIEALPPEMGKLKNLEVLEMWDNELGEVPEEVKGMYSLRVWELRGILFSIEDQNRIHMLLPECKIYFSPACNCKY